MKRKENISKVGEKIGVAVHNFALYVAMGVIVARALFEIFFKEVVTIIVIAFLPTILKVVVSWLAFQEETTKGFAYYFALFAIVFGPAGLFVSAEKNRVSCFKDVLLDIAEITARKPCEETTVKIAKLKKKLMAQPFAFVREKFDITKLDIEMIRQIEPGIDEYYRQANLSIKERIGKSMDNSLEPARERIQMLKKLKKRFPE